MKKLFTTLLLSTLTIVSYAQETFDFNTKLLPNSTYSMNMESVMDMNIEIQTEEEIPGMEKSIHSKTESDITLKTVTFSKNSSNNVPFEMSYTDINSKSFINGQLNPPTDNGLKGLYQVKIKGVDDGVKREFSEIDGPEEFKKMFEILYDSFESLMMTPKGTFKINEKHTLQNEVKVPMPDGSEFAFAMNTSFILTKIEDNKAYFDVEMSSKPVQQKMESFTIEVESYDVKGKMKLDINDNNISESTINGPMIINMVGSGFKMIMKTTYNYNIKSIKL